jgi:hypothetical protein
MAPDSKVPERSEYVVSTAIAIEISSSRDNEYVSE